MSSNNLKPFVDILVMQYGGMAFDPILESNAQISLAITFPSESNAQIALVIVFPSASIHIFVTFAFLFQHHCVQL